MGRLRTLTVAILALLVVVVVVVVGADSSEEFFGDFGESYQDFQYFVNADVPYNVLSVCVDTEGQLYTVEGTECDQRIAVGKFKDTINQTGWSYLEIETSDQFDPEIQAYAGGVAEGKLTKRVIYNHLRNTVENYCTNYTAYCERLNKFLQENMAWIRSQLIENTGDLYWQNVNTTLTQMTGILHGYEDRMLTPEVSFEISPILMANLNGDLIDLEKVLKKKKDEVMMKEPENGKCSGLVKVAPGNKDLFISQVTMSSFSTMTRVLKLYKFGYDKTKVPGHTTAFPGYPGILYSSDDFALFSSGLAALETTVNVYNRSLYEFVKPQGQLHTWLRAIIANNLAHTAKEWTDVFARYNSGTYNNQWVVLDYKLFTPGQPLPTKDLLWVLEQLPGTTMAKDRTKHLIKHTYFPSYNFPHFKKMQEISGFLAEGKRVGDWTNYNNCPRAKIFRRDHHKVVDMDSLTKLMRYNDYKNDPFSRCNCTPPYTAEAAISARGDLNPKNGTYALPGMGHVNHGGLDYKGTNYDMAKKLMFRAWAGPTYDDVPAFSWKTTDLVTPHFGMPEEYKFLPVEYQWETPVEVGVD